ncbi:MAG: tetratricopeptide repeat protein [Treponemataceae bacterium]
MEELFPILIAAIVIIAFITFFAVLISAKKKLGKNRPKKQKTRQAIINEATRKLSSDPHNIEALYELGDLYFSEKNYEKALPMFDALVNLASTRHSINVGDVNLKLGICAINCHNATQAFNALLASRRVNPDNFDVNYYMGKTLYELKEYEKAIPIVKKAITINSEIQDSYELLGQIYFDYKKYREALPYLKRTLDVDPANKAVLYNMATALSETGNSDKAIKVFIHLRPDPVYGASSCLAAGKFHIKNNQIENAIKDFEIGLKHEKAPVELMLEIKYRLATCYLKSGNIPSGLSLLKDIQAIAPNYKDISSLVPKYQELNQNSNLKTYLIGTTSDFVALCRKIAVIFFKNSRVKITNINVTSECAEILSEIDTDKWEDNVIFRFYRTTGSTGELFIRDFHAKIRDEKAGRGICFTAGTYTEEAKAFIDGRPIDLIEKTQLARLLSKVESTGLTQS